MSQQRQSFIHRVRSKLVGFVSSRFQYWFPENTESKIRPRDESSDCEDTQPPPAKRQRFERNVEVLTNLKKDHGESKTSNNNCTSTSNSSNPNLNNGYETKITQFIEHEQILNATKKMQTKSDFNIPKTETYNIVTNLPRYHNHSNDAPNSSKSLVATDKEGFKSPFYPGRTMFGGAASYLRARKRFSPSHVEVELVSSPEPPNKNEERTVNGMSLTALRILKTLESFDSPLRDAKKIPVRPIIKRIKRNSYRATVTDMFKSRKKEEQLTSKKDVQTTETVVKALNCPLLKTNRTDEKDLTEINSSYKFSSPIKLNNDSYKTENYVNNFKFSMPLKVITEKIIEKKLIDAKIPKSPSKSKITSSSVMVLPKRNQSYKNSSRLNQNVFNENYFKSFSAADFWYCVVCSVQNENHMRLCVACNSCKNESKTKTITVKKDNVIKKPKTLDIFWTCDICMIKNKQKASKCIACEGMNPNLSRSMDYNLNFSELESIQLEQNVSKINTVDFTDKSSNNASETTSFNNLSAPVSISIANKNTLPFKSSSIKIENQFKAPAMSPTIGSGSTAVITNGFTCEGELLERSNVKQFNINTPNENLGTSNVIAADVNRVPKETNNLSLSTPSFNLSSVKPTTIVSPIVFGESANSLNNHNPISNGFSFSKNKPPLFETNTPITTTFTATTNINKQSSNTPVTERPKTSTKRQLEEDPSEVPDKRISFSKPSGGTFTKSPFNLDDAAQSASAFNFSGSRLPATMSGSPALSTNGLDAVNRIAATINGEKPTLTSDATRTHAAAINGRRIRRAVRRSQK